MLLAFFLLLLTTFSGTILTYLYDEDTPLAVRISGGAAIGISIFALAGFTASHLLGLNAGTVYVSLGLTLLPVLLLLKKDWRERLNTDWQKARGSFGKINWNIENSAVGALYGGILVLLWFFFQRAMLVEAKGIFTGGSQNLGDLPFHLEVINSFVYGQNFPPENPSFAGAKFSYPYLADFIVAMLRMWNVDYPMAFFAQNMILIVALIVLLYYFTLKLTGNRTAAVIAPLLLLFSGGIGYVMFLRDAAQSEQGLFGLLMNLPDDYTIRGKGGWRWGNALTVLFMTQRSLLMGMPLALIVFTKFWQYFSAPADETKTDSRRFVSTAFVIGLMAGMLPLIHVHSLAVVFLTAGCLMLLDLKNWPTWIAFFVGATLIAVPELFLAMSGSATRTSQFIGWEFGWDHGDENPVWFWLKNTGFFIPLLLLAIGQLLVVGGQGSGVSGESLENDNSKTAKAEIDADKSAIRNPQSAIETSAIRLLLFLIPFALCFVIPNVIRLAPWVWDNIKVLIYWYVGCIPLVALVLAKMWQGAKGGKVLTIVLLIGLTLAGLLDVWRVVSGAIHYQVYEQEAVLLAEQIKQKTPPKALFLNAPTYNSVVFLTGRRSFMGYTGHLWSHGIDADSRKTDLEKIYTGDPDAERLLKKHSIEYVVVSPFEREIPNFDEHFWLRFPVVAKVGNYQVYQVK
jgi:hypothetical protein